MKTSWITPVALSALLVAGAVAYFERPTIGHADASRVDGGTNPGYSQVRDALTAGTCVAPAKGNVSRDALNEKYRWAHSLLDQKLFDVALPELRDIGRTDPGYPGINLDISTALLGTKHAEEAKDAVNAQIAISDCLSKLAPIKVDAYCRTEYSQLSSESCRPRLGQIRQTAELQAAIVHLELGHGVDPDPGPAPATAAVAKAAPAPEQILPRTSAKPKHATIAVSRPAPEKKLGDKSLMEGEGTDSELGAYSRPQ